MLEAVKAGNLELLEKLTKDYFGKYKEGLNNRGSTACHVALEHKQYVLAKKVIGSDPSILYYTNLDGITPLHLALKSSDPNIFLDCVRLFEKYVKDKFNGTKKGISAIRKLDSECRSKIRNADGKSLLYSAAEKGDVEAVTALLRTSDLIEVTLAEEKIVLLSETVGPNGCTALHAAAKHKKYEVIQFFMKNTPDLAGHQDGKGCNPLHYAVLLNDKRMVDLLLNKESGDTANQMDSDGFSPFHMTARLGYKELFEFFLKRIPNCYSTTNYKGRNVLHIAVEENVRRIVELIAKGKKTSELLNVQDCDGNTPLDIATSRNNKKMQNLLFDSLQGRFQNCHYNIMMNKEVNVVKEKLLEAAKAGNATFLDELGTRETSIYKEGLNIDEDTAFHVAVRHGQYEFAKKLFSLHPPTLFHQNWKGITPLHIALELHHDTDIFANYIRLLIDCIDGMFHRNEDVFSIYMLDSECRHKTRTADGRTLLYLATEKGYSKGVMTLFETGERFKNATDEKIVLLSETEGPNGLTALHAAVQNKDSDAVQFFMKAAPGLAGCQDEEGRNPLYTAVVENDLAIIDILLTDVSLYTVKQKDNEGLSPFLMAARLGYREIIELFMERCPDCYLETTNDGRNALHMVVEECFQTIVESIIKHDNMRELINKQDDYGNSPLHIAANKDNEKIKRLLLDCPGRMLTLRNKGSLTFKDISNSRLKEKRETRRRNLLEAMESFQSSLLVMATLILMVTFTAAFTIPGGYNGDEPNKGMPILVRKTLFKVFMVSDTISMCSSIIAAAALILFSMPFPPWKKMYTLIMAIGSIGVSMISLIVAFIAGVSVVMGHQSKWLVIFITVLSSCTPLLILVTARTIFASGSGSEDDDGYFRLDMKTLSQLSKED